MSKHTQGRWLFSDWVHVTDQGDVPTKIKGSGVPYGRTIADLNFSNKDEELSSDKVLVNAKLIAATPELLEALQALLKSFDEIIPTREELGTSVLPALLKAQAAIKKATD